LTILPKIYLCILGLYDISNGKSRGAYGQKEEKREGCLKLLHREYPCLFVYSVHPGTGLLPLTFPSVMGKIE
jgi:hypothetical protein